MERLKTRRQFQAALAGEKVSGTAHFSLHCCALTVAPVGSHVVLAGLASRPHLFAPAAVWLGAMIPKRWAKRAVTRNAIKRQIYNVSAEFEAVLPVAALVVRLRSGFSKANFHSAGSDALKLAVRKELQQLFSDATRNSGPIRASGVRR